MLPKNSGDQLRTQIANANRGKSTQISFYKQWRSFFRKIATDRIAEGIPKNNGDHFGGELLALLGDHLLDFVFNLRYREGLGPGLYPSKPISNFLSNILKFITIFLNLQGCQNPKS